MKRLPILDLKELVGGLSAPSKMPCMAWGVPATRCKTGSKLAQQEGTVCSVCYALKGRFVMSHVHDAYERRYQAYLASPKAWKRNMVALLRDQRKRDPNYFRWFDNGDVQSYTMLLDILDVARATPKVRHWLPTKEYSMVRRLIHSGTVIPPNMVIRVSSPKIGEPPLGFGHKQVWAATVGYNEGPQCPAYTQGGKCQDCRNCWDSSYPWINYPEH